MSAETSPAEGRQAGVSSRALPRIWRWRRRLVPWAKKAGVAVAITAVALALVDTVVFRGHGNAPAHVKNAKALFGPAVSQEVGHALLVNGGYGLGYNHRRYWNNLSLMYSTLKARGWTNIRVLDSDGKQGVPDRVERSILGYYSNGTLEDSPFDLDGDGVNDVVGGGTKEQLFAQLRAIGAVVKPGEPVLLFMTDHGELRHPGHTTAVAMMWEEELTGAELDTALRDALPKDTWVAVVSVFCHGAIFLSEISRPRTLLMASGSPLWIWSDQDYGVFTYHFAEALLQRDPDTLQPIASDRNHDGRVSFREAFDAAAKRDHVPEWPRYWVLGAESDLPASF
jgi:hypothetical protein